LSTVRNIAKNTAVLFIAQGISYGLGFIYTIYLARYLGPSEFGILSFAMAFATVFSVFADIGIQTIIVREVAREKSLLMKYIANVTLIKIILGIATFGLIALTINILGYPQSTVAVVYLIGIMVILNTFSQMYYSVFQAFEMMEYMGIGLILQALLVLVGVLAAINLGYDILSFALIYCLTSFLVLSYNLFVFRFHPFKKVNAPLHTLVEFDWSFWKATIYQAIPFALSTIFVNIYSWLDTVILSSMKGGEVVGYYNAAYRIVAVILFLPSAFMGAILPIMARLHVTSGDALKLSLEKSCKYLFIMGLPITVGIFILAPHIIDLVYGQQYAPATTALQILAPSIWVIFINMVLNTYLNSINRQSISAKIFFVCAVISIVMNITLIPQSSFIATSGIRTAIEYTGCILAFFSILKEGYKVSSKNTVILVVKVLIANILMGFFVAYLSDQNLALVIILSAILYFSLIVILRVFDNTDFEMAERLIGKTKL